MISIIVPVYKVTPYLRQCVESIINQTYRDLEILLIDDGSPDECGEICEEYKNRDNRIRVFHTENRGLSAARNFGLQNAAGDCIGFVDPDDWIEPDMYAVLLRGLEEADISVCGYDSGAQRVQLTKAMYTGADSLKALIDEKFNNNVWNKLYRRKLFDGVLFPEGKNYEDVAVMHRIVDRASLVAVEPSVLYHYRIRSESITKTYTAKNLMDYADARLSRYNYFLDERPDLFAEKKEELLLLATNGISKVWRWWHGCKAEEKEQYNQKISSLRSFTKENIPLFGFRSWPFPMRLSAVFMHSQSAASFAVLYYLNQLFRRLWPEKGNVV